jgi:hypothetical protein
VVSEKKIVRGSIPLTPPQEKKNAKFVPANEVFWGRFK